MDRLISVFSVYDFFSYVLAGGTLIAGLWWAISGVPSEPGTATVLGLIAGAYVVGHLVQAIGRWLEKAWWLTVRGGWPSNARMAPAAGNSHPGTGLRRTHPYQPEFQGFLRDALAKRHGTEVAKFSVQRLFSLARADLREHSADGRMELMNMLYAFSRGLMTSSLLLVVVFVITALNRHTWDPFGYAAVGALAATALFLMRFDNFGHRYADQAWQDFAAITSSTGERSP